MTWISVKDKLPEEGEPVLVRAYNSTAVAKLDLDHYSEHGWWFEESFGELAVVTHWQPLPEPPEPEPEDTSWECSSDRFSEGVEFPEPPEE